jgi:Spy/CpxP family protein refolding chaperone
MVSYSAKRLFLLVLIVATVFVTPDFVSALPAQSASSLMLDTNINTTNTKIIDLTPRQRQMIQAVNQGRNREIGKILDESQHQKLVKLLLGGDSLNQAVDRLKLANEQSDLVKTIVELYDLKMKAVTSRF